MLTAAVAALAALGGASGLVEDPMGQVLSQRSRVPVKSEPEGRAATRLKNRKANKQARKARKARKARRGK